MTSENFVDSVDKQILRGIRDSPGVHIAELSMMIRLSDTSTRTRMLKLKTLGLVYAEREYHLTCMPFAYYIGEECSDVVDMLIKTGEA